MPRILCVIFLCVAGSAAAANEPRPLQALLTPTWQDGAVTRLDVRLVIPDPEVAAGEALLRMPLVLVSIPTAAYESGDISALDDQGPVPLESLDEDPTPSGVYRQFLAKRATAGDVTVEFGTPPRAVSADTRRGPLFDLRAQPGGLVGAGVYFMAVPPGEEVYRIEIDWDLSGLPEGAMGVTSFGEGKQTTVGPAERLAFTFYAAGMVQSAPEATDTFGLYWFADPPFDADELAEEVWNLYTYMSRFFGDEGAPYRVFVRSHPYPAGGGTALPGSFAFGYGSDGQTTAHGPQQLLAHEMAHNWPRLNGGEHALTAWYTEGTAEYYALLLLWRSGAMQLDDFTAAINARAEGYYTNPYRNLSNAEAGELFWRDSRAQRVPYGRGFMYLASLDARIREATDGARSVDDLVLEVLERQRAGDTVDNDAWVELVVAELGEQAREDYVAMTQGKLIEPPENSFGPCLRPVPARYRDFELGFDEMRLGVVSDLDPSSAAAAAGVKEGDIIHTHTPLAEVRSSPDAELTLELERDGERLTISYVPRGEPVDGWAWERATGIPEQACRL